MPEFRPFDYGNVLATAEGIKGQRAQNALLGTQQTRMNALMGQEAAQENRAQAAFDRQQAEAAALKLAQRFSAVASSQSPRQAAQQFLLADPEFQSTGRMLGLPVEQFTIDETDTDDSIRQSAQEWAQALGGGMQTQSVPAELQTFQAMTQGLPSEDTERARRIALGLESRAGQLRVVDIGGVPHLAGAIDGQPFQVPMSSLQQEAGAAGTIKQAEALGSGRGQAQAEREAQAPQRIARAQQQITSIDNVIGMVDQALTSIDFGTVGAVGALSRAVPGTQAYDLNQTLLTVKANLGFDRLQQMRETSPTGGALGQVAVQELNALQAAVASLDQAQSPAQLRSNLERVREHYSNWRDTVLLSIQREQGNAQAIQTAAPQQTGPVQIQTEEEYNALPSGTQYIAPDGSMRVKQ